MYPILATEQLTPVTKLFLVEAPDVARKARPGQFVIIRLDEVGERIPLTIADFDPEAGTVTVIIQEVGCSTKQACLLEQGDAFLDLTGPLGKPSEVEKVDTAVFVGGGFGVAPTYPITRAFKQAGSHIITIMGARTKELLFWEEKMGSVSDELIVLTDDGSYGRKGLVTEPLNELLEGGRGMDVVFAIGPAIMMKFVALTTKPFGVKTMVSLNSLMVDGTGMCGCCRAEVGGETKFVCVDGIDFDAHQVDWDMLMERQRIYLDEEKVAAERCNCGG
jgi:ferredoxin--NADP+ reductase